jgi:hypothetical protein
MPNLQVGGGDMTVIAECDECGREAKVEASSQSIAIRILEHKGWKMTSTGNTCPNCVEKARHAKE